MIKKIIVLFFLTINVSVGSELKGLLAKFNTLKASFSQKVYNENKKVTQINIGELLIKKPNRFKLSLKGADGKDNRLIICNGKKIWDFDMELEQIVVSDFKKEFKDSPLGFLAQESNIEDNFTINTLKKNTFQLLPKPKSEEIQAIKISFNDKGMLQELEFIDNFGKKNVFVFSKVIANTLVEDKVFILQPPNHVEIIGN